VTRPLVVGHRGAAGLLPENTLAGFEKAIAVGADGIELDLQLDGDGQLRVRHDIVPDGAGAEPPPTLAAILGLVAARAPRMTIFIDLKATPWAARDQARGIRLVDAAAPLLARHAHPGRIVLASFDWDALEHARRTLPACRLAFHSMATRWLDHLTPAQSGVDHPRDFLAYMEGWRQARGPGVEGLSSLELIRAAGGAIWSCHHRDLTPAAAAKAREVGLAIWAWTVNAEADLQRVLRIGVAGVITDYPDRILNVLNTMDWETPDDCH
jgi:glycerophosphoryl diester phosphodiesterase